MAADGFWQSHAVFNKADNHKPDRHPLVGEGVEDPQTGAPRLCFPQELCAACEDSRDKACVQEDL
jgi:hypothetical protein